jgi:hypothetical protein
LDIITLATRYSIEIVKRQYIRLSKQ